MRLHFDTDFFACGKCGALYHVNHAYDGRGRHLGEHPEHEYAPCGHSQTWFGRRPVYIEPEPPSGLEFYDEEGA
jgi:hypothetical protein